MIESGTVLHISYKYKGNTPPARSLKGNEFLEFAEGGTCSRKGQNETPMLNMPGENEPRRGFGKHTMWACLPYGLCPPVV